MAILTWRDIERKYTVISGQVNDFFSGLQKNTNKKVTKDTLLYRPGQKEFATTVMDALTNKKILLVEAGVGIGKSYGYLIPLFYTINGIPKFKKVIISTSTIALGEQLISDVRKVCTLLDIPLEAEISKGINNYACLKNIYLAMERSKEKEDTRATVLLQKIRTQVVLHDKCDKSELTVVPNSLWKRICVKGGCNKCEYISTCSFIKKQNQFGSSNIVVTNHTQLANMIKSKNDIIKNANAVVIDEAHKLEEEMRLSFEETINITDFINKLNQIKEKLESSTSYDTYYELRELNKISSKIVTTLITLIKTLRSNANAIYNRSNPGSTDVKSAPRLNINLENSKVHEDLTEFLKEALKFNRIFNKDLPIPGIKKDIDFAKKCILALHDMSLGLNSKSIYWVKYIDEVNIAISYTKKDLSEYMELLFEENKPAILTSGTLTTNGTYDKMQNSLYLTNRTGVTTHTPIASPYDYETNSLFFYDTSLPSPKAKDHTAYIADLAIRIKELIEITRGKTLILFTAKSDMNEVYKLVSNMGLEYKLILQGEDTAKAKIEFENDVNSCLFATGTFWEGIDFKGKTLSNLIIARLPFPVEDPIVSYKINGLGRKEQYKIILDEMLLKLAQGTGRLIRSYKDTGIICSLDSRTELYLDDIQRTLQFKNYTKDMNDIINFANKKVLDSSEKKLIKKANC